MLFAAMEVFRTGRSLVDAFEDKLPKDDDEEMPFRPRDLSYRHCGRSVVRYVSGGCNGIVGRENHGGRRVKKTINRGPRALLLTFGILRSAHARGGIYQARAVGIQQAGGDENELRNNTPRKRQFQEIGPPGSDRTNSVVGAQRMRGNPSFDRLQQACRFVRRTCRRNKKVRENVAAHRGQARPCRARRRTA